MMCQKVDYMHQNPMKREFVDDVTHGAIAIQKIILVLQV